MDFLRKYNNGWIFQAETALKGGLVILARGFNRRVRNIECTAKVLYGESWN
jgi:hypothetical protein